MTFSLFPVCVQSENLIGYLDISAYLYENTYIFKIYLYFQSDKSLTVGLPVQTRFC